MGVLNLKLAELATKRIEVGFVGENLHNQVRIDSTVMFNSYPNAIPSMAITIPTGESYPVFTTREGNEIVWDIQRSALVVDGDGEIQLTFTDGEMVAKTYKCKIRIKKSIIPDGESPTIIEDWIEQANTVLNGIPQAINSALDEAKQSGEFDGATFTPQVENGVLSWTNDSDLENPEPLDLGDTFAFKEEIPAKVSDLDNDAGYLTQEIDPTVPSWAKQPNKPSYTPQEIGAMPANTSIPERISDLIDDSGFYTKPQTGIPLEDLAEDVMQAINDSSNLAPVASSGDYNDLTNKPQIPTKVSDLNNDSGFLTQETDPTVPAWAKQQNKPSYTAQEVGALPADTPLPDPTSIIDDTAGDGDTSKVWSADKTEEEVEKKYEKPQNGIPVEDLDSSLKNLVNSINIRTFAAKKTINVNEYYSNLNSIHTGVIGVEDGLKDAPAEFDIALPLKTTDLKDSDLPYIRSFEKRTNITLRQYSTKNIFNSDLFLNDDGEELLGVTINVPGDGRIIFTGGVTPIPEVADTVTLSSEYFTLPFGYYRIGIKGALYGWPIPCGFKLVDSDGNIIVDSSAQDQSFSLEKDTECSFHILYASSMDYREVIPFITLSDQSIDSNWLEKNAIKSNLIKEVTINIPQEYNFYAGYLTSDGKLHKTMECIDSYNGESINHGWISSMEEDTDDNSPTIGSTVIYPLTNEIVYDIQPINIKTDFGDNSFLVYDNAKFSLLSYYTDLSKTINNFVLNKDGTIENSLTIGNRNLYSDDSIGTKSICVGEDNVASGFVSGTFGNYNKSYGFCDYGIGYGNEIKNNYSYCVALGEYNKIGYDTVQEMEDLIDFYGGSANIALGDSNYVLGSYNVALSYGNYVAGYYSIVGGYYNFGNGSYNTVFGYNNISTYTNVGNNYLYNFVTGRYNRSTGSQNVVFGANNKIYGSNTIAFGAYLESYLDDVLILGNYNIINEPVDKEDYIEWQPNRYYEQGQKVYIDCVYPRSFWDTSTTRLYFTRSFSGQDYDNFNYWTWDSVKSNYIEIFGNGDGYNRSNARTLDRNGNEWLAGGLTLNGSLCTYNPELNAEEKDPFKFYRIGEIVKQTTTDPSSGEEIVKYYHYNQEGLLGSWILIPDGAKKYVEMIGGGDTNNRLNLRTLDWGGNQRLLGTLYVESNHEVVKQLRDPNSKIGENSVAIGYNSIASGSNSVAIGYETIATGYNQFVFGLMNAPTEGEQIPILNADPWEQNHEYVSGDVVSYTDNGVTQYYMCHNYAPAVLRPRTNLIHNIWVPYTPEDGEDMSNVEYWVESGIYSMGNKVKDIAFDGKEYYYLCTVDNPETTIYPINYTYWHTLPSEAVVTLPNKFIEIAGNGQGSGWDGDRRNARLLDIFGNEYLGGTLYVGCDSLGKNGIEVVTKEDKATSSTLGLVKVGDGAQYGITMLSDGTLRTLGAYNAQIKAGTDAYRPIVPEKQDVAVFYGLSKLAGVDLKNSNTPVGTYTQEAKTAIQNMLGIESDIPLVEEISGSTPSITGMPNVRYNCGTCSLLTITPPAAGSIVVRFHSGSIATVLTVPNTVKFPAWFDYTSLDVDTTYEVIITDGVYGGIMSWAD